MHAIGSILLFLLLWLPEILAIVMLVQPLDNLFEHEHQVAVLLFHLGSHFAEHAHHCLALLRQDIVSG